MRALWLIVLCCIFSNGAIAALYKHVDDQGKVTYSDRPQRPQQEALNLPPPNVATPEARRQLDLARQAWEREEQEDYAARMRRAAGAYRAAAATPSRPLYRGTSGYGGYGYGLPYYVVYARTPAQGNPSQGLQPARLPHRAGSSRR